MSRMADPVGNRVTRFALERDCAQLRFLATWSRPKPILRSYAALRGLDAQSFPSSGSPRARHTTADVDRIASLGDIRGMPIGKIIETAGQLTSI